MCIPKTVLAALLATAVVPAAVSARTLPADEPQVQQKQTLDAIKKDTPQDALVGFLGVNYGGGLYGGGVYPTMDVFGNPRVYGASLLFRGSGVFASEIDLGYNPGFYDGLPVVSPDGSSNMYTLTLNMLVGPTFYIGQGGRIRPYGLFGGGSDAVVDQPVHQPPQRDGHEEPVHAGTGGSASTSIRSARSDSAASSAASRRSARTTWAWDGARSRTGTTTASRSASRSRSSPFRDMPLVAADHLSIAFGHLPLLDDASLVLEPGERVAVIGRNGTGKSTLLKIVNGELAPDAGTVWTPAGVRTARLDQDAPLSDRPSGVRRRGRRPRRPERSGGRLSPRRGAGRRRGAHPSVWTGSADCSTSSRSATAGASSSGSSRCSRTSHSRPTPSWTRCRAAGGAACCWRVRWCRSPTCCCSTSRRTTSTSTPSPGSRPTWPSSRARCSSSRTTAPSSSASPRASSNWTAGRVTSWPGDYATFLRKKEEWLANEAIQQDKFDKRLAEEEAWLRQGVKARRTRNEGRVRALLAHARGARRPAGPRRHRPAAGGARGSDGQDGVRGGRGFASRSTAGRSCATSRPASCAATGSASSGRTAPARRRCCACCWARLAPDEGEVRQRRERAGRVLRPAARAARPGADGVRHDRRRQRGGDGGRPGAARERLPARLSLFPPERARSPVKALSGGERNRLLLARLFTRPANVLVLDEPTNDLDLETLELLEAQLVEWPGTLLLVSHDRVFLDNVVTSTLVFEGDGRVARVRGRLRGLGAGEARRGDRGEPGRGRGGRRRHRRPRCARPQRRGPHAGAQAPVLHGAARVRSAAGAHRGARGRAGRAAAARLPLPGSTRSRPRRSGVRWRGWRGSSSSC